MNELSVKAEVLLITRAGKKHGMGHFKRTLRLAALTDTYSVVGILADPSDFDDVSSLISDIPMKVWIENRSKEILREIEELDPNLCVLDLRETPTWLARFLYNHFIPMVLWDDYSMIAKWAEVSISALPHPSQQEANFFGSDFVPMDAEESEYRGILSQEGSILVSFGGSDPAGLSQRVGEILLEADITFTLIQGPLSAPPDWARDQEGIQVIDSPPSLLPYLVTHETLITTVGMTLMEALKLGRKAILVHPTSYHARLAREMDGVIDLGEGRFLKKESLLQALKLPLSKEKKKQSNLDYHLWWNDLVNRLILQENAVCPVCGSSKREVWQRRESWTLFHCAECGSNYQYVLNEEKVDYESDYFERRYRKAYGKSYEEDFDILRDFACRRLDKIRSWVSVEGSVLVDVGSALGVFAYAAKTFGFEAWGVEVSDFAARYAKKHFGLSIVKDLFEIPQKIDVLTLWFTLEHFDSPMEWLERAIEKIKPGGVLCLGLPNGEGATARWNRKWYLQHRPEEHVIEPSLRGMKNFLQDRGMEILDVEIFGLHPDRYGLPDWEVFRTLQKKINYGDTFEIYARKRLASSDPN